jgi:phosphate transport system permease protein
MDYSHSETLETSAPLTVESFPAKTKRRDTHSGDQIFHGVLKVIAWSVILLLIGIVFMLTKMAWPTLRQFGLHFFIADDWNPPMDIFGALPFIYGTVASSLIAILIAGPVSIGVALFLVELAPRRLAKLIGFLVEMLAAIPSVVYGLWGIFILAPWMQHHVQPTLTLHLGPDSNFALSLGRVLTAVCYPFVLVSGSYWTLNATAEACQQFAQKIFAGPNYGVGLLTASFILAIMITPTISSVSREIFGTVSSSIREAALALGATRWEMIRMAVLKTSRSGILGAVILGLGRALGETMAVTMVIGNRNEIKAAIMAPAQTMASVIANEYPEATGLHISSLAAIGLALFAVSLVINSLARLIIWHVERGRH